MMQLLSGLDSARERRLDRLGVVIGLLLAVALSLPFALLRANRIVPGEGLSIWQALAPGWATGLLIILLTTGLIVVLRLPAPLKLGASLVALGAIALGMGIAADRLVPDQDRFARVAPGAGFWLMLLALGLVAADSLTRLRFGPWTRIGLLVLVMGSIVALLSSGIWSEVSMIKEYATRAEAFWTEARTHILLVFGSMVAALIAGVPLGVACWRLTPIRMGVLGALNVIQTTPSIALFGLLIAPLGWIAANVPGMATIGVSGIGMAPALVALFAYSLLPIVANTVVGLDGVPAAVTEAARGMGMTRWQRLRNIQFPLALPVILAGIRIVLVQNIGLATVAALIGGGGFGVFVFQGIGQTADDLVLLGALPTVMLAFSAAVILDAVIELASVRGGNR